jgi:hypothetical protein
MNRAGRYLVLNHDDKRCTADELDIVGHIADDISISMQRLLLRCPKFTKRPPRAKYAVKSQNVLRCPSKVMSGAKQEYAITLATVNLAVQKLKTLNTLWNLTKYIAYPCLAPDITLDVRLRIRR